MEAPGRPPVTIDLSAPGSETTLKDHPFKIKEGAKFTMRAAFKVQHEILSGLQYVQIVKRKGIRVSKDSEMIVSLLFQPARLPVAPRSSTRLTSECRAATHPTPRSSLPTPSNVRRRQENPF